MKLIVASFFYILRVLKKRESIILKMLLITDAKTNISVLTSKRGTVLNISLFLEKDRCLESR